MRVNCYNASECTVRDIVCGDTFYYGGELCIKVAPFDVDVIAPVSGRCYIVVLSTGELKSIKEEAPVTSASNTEIITKAEDVT